jgi:hypothetical protein
MDLVSAATAVTSEGAWVGGLALGLLGLGATRTADRGAGDGEDGGRYGTPAEAAQAVLVAAAFGIGGFLGIVLWASMLSSVARGVLGTLSTFEETAVLQLSNGLGTVSGAWLYLEFADREYDFLDVRWPTRRDVGYAVAGLVVILGSSVAISVAMNVFGIESAAHGTSETLANAGNPLALTALFAVTSVLLIGPGEELLYRNVVQKSLYDAFPRAVSVGVASVVFAAVHYSAYSTGSLGQVLLSLLTVFVLSLTLGAVYERTDNVVVPAAVHGLFNASQFLLIAYSQGTLAAAPLPF